MKEHAQARDAAEWFLIIHAEKEPDAETLQAWLQWMEASAEHRHAFEQIVQIWQDTPAAVIPRSARPETAEGYDGSTSIVEWRARRAQGKHGDVTAVSRAGRRRWFAAAMAAGLLVAAFVAYRVYDATGEFATDTGGQRQISLSDGSRVTLGADSRLAVNMQPTLREVRLETGEAYFSVSKDPTRPFVVRALGSTITAVGTAFNVRAVGDRVTVTVSEGSVRFEEKRPENGSVRHWSAQEGDSLLTRGEQLTYTRNAPPVIAAASVKKVDTQEPARWREGWLVYRDEPLRYVIADIARYTEVDVQVSEAAAAVRFSGTVSRDHIDEWIAALPTVSAVSVERSGAGFMIDAQPGTVQ